MRIGIHAHLLYSGESYRNAGISQYIRHLLFAMQDVEHGHDITAFVNSSFSEMADFPRLHFDQTKTAGESPLQRILFEQLLLPAVCRRLGIDVLHGTAFALPRMAPCPGVVTVHDAGFIRFSDKHHNLNRRYLVAVSRMSAKRARRIIAVSKSVADDAVALLGAPRERIRVVYHGVDPMYRPAPSDAYAAFRERKGLTDPYILFVGTLEPRKNLWTLLKAFSLARKQGVTHSLVVVGGAGWLVEDMLRRVKEEGLDQGVHFAGYAPLAEMPLWYGAADVFVYPSLLEGFGLPVLEAMACGAPIITSNCSSLPEVGGEAAAYVTPTDSNDIANRLVELVRDPDRRAAMSAASLTRATQFRWEKTARETLDVYCEAAR